MLKNELTNHRANQAFQPFVFMFDIDGTLIDECMNMSDDIPGALARLKDRGHFVTIATGRSKIECNFVLDAIVPNAPTILLDGQLISMDGNIIQKRGFFEDLQIRELYHKWQKSYYFFWEDESCVYAEDKFSRMLYSIAFNCERKYIRLFDERKEGFQPIRIFMKLKDASILPVKTYEISQIMNKEVDIYQYSENGEWMVIKPAKFNKVDALPYVCKYCDIRPENVIFFGDSSNDIKLMNNVGFRVAMGNAIDDVKKIADCTIQSVKDNGVYHFLCSFEKFIL